MKIVTEIAAIAPIKKLKKVCAYARVSKDKDAMLQSLSSQVSHYNKFISSNPEWQFAGVYADEGISGTKEDRPEFLRMVEDAKAGKIDMIITKSISRFGRNTETVIKTVRMLKAINVDVYFESQKMHTLSEEGEFMLTVLASYYQEEARSVSENMKWRIKKDFEQGIAWGGNDNFGYKLNGRTLEIIPEQAKIVKRIFDMYINGLGVMGIANALNEEEIKSTMGGKWIKSNVLRVITNINYIGDRVLQTTFRPDFLSKKKKINKGELKQYYVEDDHEPIIDKETFMKAQLIKEERAKRFKLDVSKRNITYPFTQKIRCSCCGSTYQHKTTKYNQYWICSTFNMKGKKNCMESKQIPEEKLYEAINSYLGIDKFNEDLFNKKIDYIVAKTNNVLEVHLFDGTTDEIKWTDPTRKNSWTPEMKEKARIKSKEIEKNRKRGADGKWVKSE